MYKTTENINEKKTTHRLDNSWSGQSVNWKICWNVHPKYGTVNFS